MKEIMSEKFYYNSFELNNFNLKGEVIFEHEITLKCKSLKIP